MPLRKRGRRSCCKKFMKPFEVYLISSGQYWYVGSTSRGMELRVAEHKQNRNSNAPRLTAMIATLGPDAFTAECLVVG